MELYEQKYNAALEKLQEALAPTEDGCKISGLTRGCIENIFPELKESEGEEIRKWLINEIKIKHHNLDEENIEFVDKAIAWLEKQGHMLDPDKVIEWLEEHVPTKFDDMANYVQQFKKDFGL